MASRRPRPNAEGEDVSMGLIYAAWALFGSVAGLALLGLLLALFPGLPLVAYDVVQAFSPPLSTALGVAFHGRRRRHLSKASVAAAVAAFGGAIGLLAGGLRINISPFALTAAPPAFVLSGFLLVAALERPRDPISREAFLVVALSTLLLMPLIVLLVSLRFPGDRLGPAILVLDLIIGLAWTFRWIIARLSRGGAWLAVPRN